MILVHSCICLHCQIYLDVDLSIEVRKKSRLFIFYSMNNLSEECTGWAGDICAWPCLVCECICVNLRLHLVFASHAATSFLSSWLQHCWLKRSGSGRSAWTCSDRQRRTVSDWQVGCAFSNWRWRSTRAERSSRRSSTAPKPRTCSSTSALWRNNSNTTASS